MMYYISTKTTTIFLVIHNHFVLPIEFIFEVVMNNYPDKRNASDIFNFISVAIQKLEVGRHLFFSALSQFQLQ